MKIFPNINHGIPIMSMFLTNIDAVIFHGFSLDPATRSEIPLGRGFVFGLGILFDSE